MKETAAPGSRISTYTTIYKPAVRETPIAVEFEQPVAA
jgi:hypothetical protein